MSKQIPLRIDSEIIEEIEKLKQHYGIATTNKVIASIILSHRKVEMELEEAKNQVIDLNIKIGELKRNYELMLYYKDELYKLIK